jgi:hypothetical protein
LVQGNASTACKLLAKAKKEILMKSMEANVPRNLVDKVYPHPELHGDFVVTLINGMVTDVFYDEDGCYKTITNDEDLIHYLHSQEHINPVYFFRNGVFSYREITKDDNTLLDEWKNITTISITKTVDMKTCNPNNIKRLPNKFIFMFYWIEVGIVRVVDCGEYIELILDVYDDDFVCGIDKQLALDALQWMLEKEPSLDFK